MGCPGQEVTQDPAGLRYCQVVTQMAQQGRYIECIGQVVTWDTAGQRYCQVLGHSWPETYRNSPTTNQKRGGMRNRPLVFKIEIVHIIYSLHKIYMVMRQLMLYLKG